MPDLLADAVPRPRTRAAMHPFGRWQGETGDLAEALADVSRPVVVVETEEGPAATSVGRFGDDGPPVVAVLPALPPIHLGDRSFCGDHRIKFPYVTGAMANGIASVEIVEAMAEAGMMGFFGAAGLSLQRIDAALTRLRQSLGSKTFGCNLIHSPNEQGHEAATVDLFLRHELRLVEASAYLDLTPHIVRYRLTGIEKVGDEIVTPNRVVAKVSRIEVAAKFMGPAPERMVAELVAQGHLTPQQADWAKRVPVAQDITVEADSGGHTDNRPAITLLPTILALRDRLQEQHGYAASLRVGLGGGIATPSSAAAAFAMGAAFIVTGTVNQACVESGSSDAVRLMLAEAAQADVAMAPAADMFEMGVKLQVLKRGTMFPMRAGKLYELYRAYPSIDAIPANERTSLEKTVFRHSFDEVWSQTRDFWMGRDPGQVTKADADAKHKMALVFRWYLGQSSRWANAGVADRKLDYQVWCGPAMGAFNEWARGSFLEDPKNRRVATIALNLLYGASLALRQGQLRTQGIDVVECPRGPWTRDEIERRLA